jgi:aspartate/methionine/tyrosine aminotransferase
MSSRVGHAAQVVFKCVEIHQQGRGRNFAFTGYSRNALDRIATLRPTAVNAILAEVREARSAGIDIVSLMRGEPDFPTPPHIVEACAKALRDGRTGYPDNRGEPNFREAVALKLQRDNGLRFDPATEILATSGATFGIYAALTALIEEGDEVLLPDPIYDAYQSPIRMLGGLIRPVAARIENGRFAIDIEALERAWTPAAKVLILNTPWNPVGSVMTRRELEQIGTFCERRDLTLISDEIYEAIAYEGTHHVSPLAACPKLRSRYLHINSLSKTYAMTGWRVGYCAGPAAIVQRMFLVLAQSSRGPATFIQDAAAVALSGSQDCVAGMRTEYARRRDEVLAAGFPVLAPEGGFFAMIDVRDRHESSDAIRKRLLRDQGVVVVHGAAYGPAGEGTLRVSFGSGGDVLREGLARLRRGLS